MVYHLENCFLTLDFHIYTLLLLLSTLTDDTTNIVMCNNNNNDHNDSSKYISISTLDIYILITS